MKARLGAAVQFLRTVSVPLALGAVSLAAIWGVSALAPFHFPKLATPEPADERTYPYQPRRGDCSPAQLQKLQGEVLEKASDACNWKVEDYRLRNEENYQAERAGDAAFEGVKLSFFQTRIAFIQACLSALALVFTGWAAWAAATAARAATEGNRIAHTSMVTSRRPWLTVDVIALDAIKGETSIYATLHLRVRNVGETPAVVTHTRVRLLAPPNDGRVNAQRALSEEVRRDASPSVLTRNLFPEQIFDVTHGPSTGTDQIALLLSRNELNQEGKRWLPLTAIGCVQYRAIGSDVLHQTGFILDIYRRTPTGASMLFFEDLPVRAEEIILSTSIEGDAVID